MLARALWGRRWLYLTHPRGGNRQDALPVGEAALGDLNAMVRIIHREMSLMPARLLGEETEVHDAVDRARAEAEFRIGVAAPLVGLAVSVAIMLSAVAGATVLVGSALLFASGMRRLDEADHLVLEALRAKEGRLGEYVVGILHEFAEAEGVRFVQSSQSSEIDEGSDEVLVTSESAGQGGLGR
ncbi:hypothetical protein [Nonomuraea typhae]|uniref:hypothetical protein n=1 Tax=Nonomuraea typhae TaxID=2603600 RepID=UPI0012FB8E17|nr:hypothetical protein [Nonomuraea typhae]